MARALVAGAAGFLGSHLVEHLLARGDDVVAVDNLLTGRRENLEPVRAHQRFTFVECDVSQDLPVQGEFDLVLHFASPASPRQYLAHPFETLDAGSIATRRLLELAERSHARFLLASTSEIYGNPLVHPQPESYWGNVNPVGPRSVYDEAKRFAEALTMAFSRHRGVNAGIVRIFNTYGPRLHARDGRVVSNFLVQAMEGRPLTVFGDGSQTRSFCYVDDEIRGILALLDSDIASPINIGNPDEFSVLELASIVRELTGSASEIVFRPLPVDDPTQRRPDIRLAKEQLAWAPRISLRQGLRRLLDWYGTEGIIGSR